MLFQSNVPSVAPWSQPKFRVIPLRAHSHKGKLCPTSHAQRVKCSGRTPHAIAQNSALFLFECVATRANSCSTSYSSSSVQPKGQTSALRVIPLRAYSHKGKRLLYESLFRARTCSRTFRLEMRVRRVEAAPPRWGGASWEVS